MAMATSAHFLPPFPAALIVVILALVSVANATDHIVGGHLGWNPNINYSLWSNNQTFLVEDLISFRYTKNRQYNVFEVNKTGYENCTMDGLVGNWSSGKDFILLDKPKTYYFICGNGFCLNGMKVAVTVHKLPSNSSSSSMALPEKAEPESSVAAVRHRQGLFGLVLVAVWILAGTGWM